MLIVLISITTAWLVNDRLTAGVYSQSMGITQQLADNSVFLLLVPEDSQVAESIAQTLNSFPSVQFVEVVDENFKSVTTAGEPTSEWMLSDETRPVDEPMLAHDGGCCWHFIAPVDTVTESPSEIQSSPAESMRLGYVHVAAKKGPVKSLIRSVIIVVAAIAFILSAALGLLLVRRIRRMTEPLEALEHVMTDAMEQEATVRAAIDGPMEVQSIATVFNTLMEYRDAQADVLETQVRERTSQLEYARDEALAAEREKSEFMAMFTHEMKAPLHAITSYLAEASSQLDFVRDKETADRIRQALIIIGVESQELHHRITQILELRGLESGNVRIDVGNVDVAQLLQLVDDTIRPIAMKNGNQLELVHTGTADIRYDYDKLLQIVENVVSNACSFTSNGHVTVKLNVESDRIAVDTRDNGIGIAPEQHTQVFTAFYQVDMSDTREHGGTGLGLAIVQRLTELLGGTLLIESELGSGTRIKIHLPLPLQETNELPN